MCGINCLLLVATLAALSTKLSHALFAISLIGLILFGRENLLQFLVILLHLSAHLHATLTGAALTLTTLRTAARCCVIHLRTLAAVAWTHSRTTTARATLAAHLS